MNVVLFSTAELLFSNIIITFPLASKPTEEAERSQPSCNYYR